MSELEKALAALGESAPESRVDPRRPLVADAMLELDEYRALALRLAVRLERAERCRECDGTGQKDLGSRTDEDPRHEYDVCAACSGTGKEQPR